MIQSASKLQDQYRRNGKPISYDDAIKICQNNPFLLSIEGNNDKFKMKSDEEIKRIMKEKELGGKDNE